jgi:hypothetical protein
MFRHSTKQNVRSQELLKKQATRALNDTRQILCDSVYSNTYGVNLPSTSADMLDNIVSSMTGCNSRASVESRKVFTIAALEYTNVKRIRICFVQPEVSSATGNTGYSFSSALNDSRSVLLNRYNNPTPGRIATSSKKCQIAGRLAPYIAEESGLSGHISWSYFNASKSRLVYVVTSLGSVNLMSLTKETISIYQSFCVSDCAIVYVPTTRCFKITAAPEDDDSNEDPNKSTCIFLYHDGTFKVLGTPHKSYKVCKLFKDTIVRAHVSPMHSRILDTLCPAQNIGAQQNG